MEFDFISRQKNKFNLKIQKIFKEKHIVIKIDNNINEGTDDFEAEAKITVDEAKMLINYLQQMIDDAN